MVMAEPVSFKLNDGPIDFVLNAETEETTEDNARLLEDGEFRLLEDDEFRLLE